MNGELVPVVLAPRFTSHVGQSTFATAPLDVTPYSTLEVSFWRGKLLGTSPTFTAHFEGSHDGVQWFPLDANNPTITTVDTWSSHTFALKWRWVRVRVVLSGTGPAISLWIAGGLERRIE